MTCFRLWRVRETLPFLLMSPVKNSPLPIFLRLTGLPDIYIRQPRTSHFYHHSQNLLRLDQAWVDKYKSFPLLATPIFCPHVLDPHSPWRFEKERKGPKMKMCCFWNKKWKGMSFVRAETKDKWVRQGVKRRKEGTHEMGNPKQPALSGSTSQSPKQSPRLSPLTEVSPGSLESLQALGLCTVTTEVNQLLTIPLIILQDMGIHIEVVT